MFVYNWFKDTLSSIGLLKQKPRILILGLDNAGKATLLYRVKVGSWAQELDLGSMSYSTYDVGVSNNFWKNNISTIDGVIYIVDALDPSRFEESKKALDEVLAAPKLANVPFAIFGNKIDRNGAVSEEDLRFAIGLAKKGISGTEKINEIDGRPIEVFMGSFAKDTSYPEGFKWLRNKFLK